MNLYDIAGNLWEWTLETAYIKGTNYEADNHYNTYMVRGGCLEDYISTYITACSRGGDCAFAKTTYMGFRVALYLE